MLDLIAYEYYKNPYVQNDIYPSGEKQETNLTNRYSYGQNNTVLVLKEDIVNKNGYGLKKGFYNIKADEYLDFLLIYQKGELKAKVPIIQIERDAPVGDGKQKVKKMSLNAYKNYQKKLYKKYYKGENPETVDYSEAEIEYVRENDAWVIIYRTPSLVLSGIIKI